MYGVVACSKCGRKRVADLSSEKSTCPYCGKSDKNATLDVFYKNSDAEAVRAAFSGITGYSGGTEKKHADPMTDPYSSLVYRYEHCRSLDEKLTVLSEGLTKIYGTFTLEDIMKIEPKNAEKYLGSMLEKCYAHEVKYGQYRS